MAGVSVYQMIELMPRDQWNLKPSKSEYDRFHEDEDVGKSPEEIVHAQLRRLIIEDEANKAQTDTWDMEQKAGTGMFQVEHTAVDEADLTIYKPFAMRSDALLNAVMTAFDRHHPIVFTPDLVYAYIAKGVATHINKFSEQLRKLYVSFDGKQELEYRNDSFRQGKKENDWADMFKNFADHLNDKTKGNSVVQNGLSFSTSSQMTEAHRHVLAIEGMKSYYDYQCYTTLCGMSCIILEGTAEDWRLVQKTVMAQLNEINDFCDKNGEAKEATLNWWSPTVEVMLDQFVTTYETRARGEDLPANLATWWRTIYKYNAARGSGGVATATGWINIFYPYLTKEKQNPWVTHMASLITDAETFADILKSFFIAPEDNEFGRGRKRPPTEVELEDYPSYVASVPFTWVYFGTKYKMNTLIGYSVGAQVAVEGKQYPVGTIKLFPAWTIYYRE